MRRIVCSSLILLLGPLLAQLPAAAQAPLPLSREQVAALPPAAARPVDFRPRHQADSSEQLREVLRPRPRQGRLQHWRRAGRCWKAGITDPR